MVAGRSIVPAPLASCVSAFLDVGLAFDRLFEIAADGVVGGAGATLRRVCAALAVWAAEPLRLRGSLPPLPRPIGPPKARRWAQATS